MGILKASNRIVNNSIELLDKILNSEFSNALDGEGQAVLVKYWNINDILTTSSDGLNTIDDIIGKQSPIRYNYIENLPIMGLGQLQLDMDNNEFLFDLNIEIEITYYPNTIKPSPYDFFEYKFKNNNLIFQIIDFKIGTVRNNDFYKATAILKNINDNDDFHKKISKQVIDNMKVRIDQVGSNQKFVLLNSIYDKIEKLEKLRDELAFNYLNSFYIENYKSIVLTNCIVDKYTLYDPYLTIFISESNLLDTSKEFILLTNYDTRHNVIKLYNKSIYNNIKTKNKNNIKKMQYLGVPFSNTTTNPFAYMGDIGYTIDLYEYSGNEIMKPQNQYLSFNLIDSIMKNEIIPIYNIFEVMLIRYFNNDNILKIINNEEIDALLYNAEFEINDENFKLIPICIYIINHIINHITTTKL